MPELENARLRVFRAVAEHLNFRKAAEHLFLTQPAVTLQIKALENELGVRLFDRSAARITLTPQGTILLEYANRVVALLVEAEREIGESAKQVVGEFSLGVSTTIAQYVLPRLLGAFRQEHPRIRFHVHSGNTSEIVAFLLNEKVSVGLIEGPTRERGVKAEPFMSDELVLIVPANFRANRVSREQFLSSTLLMREQGSGSRHVVEAALKKAGYRLKNFAQVMDLDSTEAIKSAVEVGLGVGYVSRWAIAKELELGALKIAEVAGVTVERQFLFVSPAGSQPQGAVAAFRSFALARTRSFPRPR